MKKRISIIAALALVSIALFAPASQAAANRYITVKAQGTVQVTPDAVRISATATNIAATSKEALAATSKSSASIRAALKSSKIDSKMLQHRTSLSFQSTDIRMMADQR